MDDLLNNLINQKYWERLHSLSLASSISDISSKNPFFEKEVLNSNDFPFAENIYIPENKGFRQAPTINVDHKEWYEESYGLKVLNLKALNVLTKAEIPSPKASEKKIFIYTIQINVELSESQQPTNLRDDAGENYRQTEWMKILTILGLPINTNVIVSKATYEFLQSFTHVGFNIDKISQTKLFKKDIKSITEHLLTNNPFEVLSLKYQALVKPLVDLSYNVFSMMPKTKVNAEESLKLEQLHFYHLQSYLLHQQLRLELCLAICSFKHFDSIEIEQSPFKNQLFSKHGFDFWVFNVDPETSSEMSKAAVPKNELLSSFFWHLMKEGFYISYFSPRSINITIEESEVVNEPVLKQHNMFESRPSISEQIFTLLTCLLSDTHIDSTLPNASQLIETKDFDGFYNLIKKTFL